MISWSLLFAIVAASQNMAEETVFEPEKGVSDMGMDTVEIIAVESIEPENGMSDMGMEAMPIVESPFMDLPEDIVNHAKKHGRRKHDHMKSHEEWLDQDVIAEPMLPDVNADVRPRPPVTKKKWVHKVANGLKSDANLQHLKVLIQKAMHAADPKSLHKLKLTIIPQMKMLVKGCDQDIENLCLLDMQRDLEMFFKKHLKFPRLHMAKAVVDCLDEHHSKMSDRCQTSADRLDDDKEAFVRYFHADMMIPELSQDDIEPRIHKGHFKGGKANLWDDDVHQKRGHLRQSHHSHDHHHSKGRHHRHHRQHRHHRHHRDHRHHRHHCHHMHDHPAIGISILFFAGWGFFRMLRVCFKSCSKPQRSLGTQSTEDHISATGFNYHQYPAHQSHYAPVAAHEMQYA